MKHKWTRKKQGSVCEVLAEMKHNRAVGRTNFIQGVPGDIECTRRWEEPEWREQRSKAHGGQDWRTAGFRSVSSEEVGVAQCEDLRTWTRPIASQGQQVGCEQGVPAASASVSVCC